MKNKYPKRYKLQAGVQQIQMDTPDYGKAYEIQAEQAAKNKGISQVAQQFSGAFAPVGQVGGMAADVIRNRSKNKKAGSVAGGAVEMGTSGAALGMQLGGPWGAAAGLAIGGTYGAIKGAQDYKKIKAAAQAEEQRVETANFNKTVKEGSSTDAQSFLAKKGKYKVKTKQPRLIETEGREPIFSPKKADGTRDLLYYNPNDPTHEEGGVKAVVMPRAQAGKQSVKSKTKSENTEDKDSWFENFVEIIDPFGVTSSDDAYRSIKNVKNNPSTEATIDAALESAGALPLVKKAKLIGKLKRSFEAGKFAGRGKGVITDILGGPLSNEGYNKIKGTYKGRNILPEYYNKETVGMGAPAFKQGTSNLMPKRSKVSLLGSGNMAVGARQVKVKELNDTSLSENLGGMPAVNAANKFVQPMAGIQQVARNIPEYRRKATIKNPMSHRKENPDTNRIIDPPVPYELKPKPEKSHSKKVKVYR